MTLSSTYTACTLCEAAYTLALTGSVTLPAGWAPAKPITATYKGSKLLANDPWPIVGMETVDPDGQQWIVFRGTLDDTGDRVFLKEWISDALALPMTQTAQGGVHKGAWESYMEMYLSLVKIGIRPDAKIAAHSRGCWFAAYTSVGFQPAALGMNLICIEGPKPGDARLAANLSQSGWLVNHGDIVPSLPLNLNWVRPGTTTTVYGPAGDLKTAHALSSVVAGLDRLQEVAI